MPDIFDTLETSETRDVFDEVGDVFDQVAAAPAGGPELREPSRWNKIALSPVGQALGLGRAPEREMQREQGGGSQGVMPQDVLNKGFQFLAPPPQVTGPIRSVTKPAIDLLPKPVAGVAEGVENLALDLPWAAAGVGLGTATGRALLGLFGGEFALSVPDRWAQFQAARKAGDLKGAARIATETLGTGGLLAAGGVHEAKAIALNRALEAQRGELQRVANYLSEQPSVRSPQQIEQAVGIGQKPSKVEEVAPEIATRELLEGEFGGKLPDIGYGLPKARLALPERVPPKDVRFLAKEGMPATDLTAIEQNRKLGEQAGDTLKAAEQMGVQSPQITPAIVDEILRVKSEKPDAPSTIIANEVAARVQSGPLPEMQAREALEATTKLGDQPAQVPRKVLDDLLRVSGEKPQVPIELLARELIRKGRPFQTQETVQKAIEEAPPYRTRENPQDIPVIGRTPIEQQLVKPEGVGTQGEIVPVERGTVKEQAGGKASFAAEAPTLAQQPLPERTLKVEQVEQRQMLTDLTSAIKELNASIRGNQLKGPEKRPEPPPAIEEPSAKIAQEPTYAKPLEAKPPQGNEVAQGNAPEGNAAQEPVYGRATPEAAKGQVEPTKISPAAAEPTSPVPNRPAVEASGKPQPPSPASAAGENISQKPSAKPRGDEARLYEADEFTSKASVTAEKAVQEWATHVETVVNPLKKKISQLQSDVGQMSYDAKRTLPETKGKSKLSKKAFFEKYGVKDKDEANALYRQKNAEWEAAERELEQAEARRKELQDIKDRRGKEWSAAATRAGEIRRELYPKVKEGDVGKSSQALGIVPGAGPLTRAAGELVRDIFIGARRAVAPQNRRGGITEPYSTPMLDRLDQLGGPVSRKVADEARQIDSRAVALAGDIAPVIDKARSLAAKAFRGGTTWIRGITRVNDNAAISRLHTLEGPDKAAVVALAPDRAKPMVEAIWDANYATGQLAQRGAQGFVASGKIQRILTNRGLDTIREGGGLLWERWARGTAQANGKPLNQVEAFMRRWKTELDKPSPDVASLDRIAQDFHREFPKAVSHVKLGGAWVEMLVSDPVDYLNAAAERTARAVAFREVYPATPDGAQYFAATRESVMKELPTNRHKAEFDNLMRTLQGHPLDAGFEAVSSPVGVAASEAVSTVTRPLKSAMLSLSSLVNAAETIVGGPAIFLRYRNILPLLTKNPKTFYKQLEMNGAVNRSTRNFAFNPTKPLQSISRMVSGGIGRITASNFFNEIQEYTGSGAAKVFADRVRAGDLTPGEVADFTSVLRSMGLRDRAKAIAEGRDAEGLAMFEREAAPFLSMGHDRPAVRSRLGNSRAFNSLFWFHRYPQMVLNQLRGITNNLIEDARKGDGTAALRDAKLMGRFLGMKAAQGALGTLLVTLVKEWTEGVGEQAEEARRAFSEFLLAATMQAIGGPLTIAQRLGQKVNEAEDIPGELAKASAPVSAAMDAINALTGKGRFEGFDLEERLDKWIQSKSPALRAAKNALNKAAVLSTPGLAESDIRKRVGKFMENHPDAKVRTQWEERQDKDFGTSPYKPLRVALQANDPERAKAAIADLKAGGRTAKDILEAFKQRGRYKSTNLRERQFKFQEYQTPFATGNKDLEREFIKGLTPEQKKVYQKAQTERQQLFERLLPLLK